MTDTVMAQEEAASKSKKKTNIEKLIAPHSFKPEFVKCLADIEREYGFDLFQLSGIGKQLDINWFAKQFFGKKTNTADVSVDSNSNVSLKNVVIWDNELSKPLKLISSYYRMWKGMKKKYGLEYANEAVRKQITGEIYINDFHSFASNLYYSYYGKTVITVRYRGQLLTLNMEELFDMFKDNVEIFPDKETINLTNVNIQVLDKGGKFIKLTHVLRHRPHNELLKIETKNGMTTVVTEDHPVILEDGSEKFASDLSIGDRLMISDCKYDIFDDKNTEIDRTKYLVGFVIGDGYLTGGTERDCQAAIAQKGLEQSRVYQYILEESPDTTNKCNKTNTEGMSFVNFGNKCWVCKNADIKKGAQNKTLPKDILNWNKSEILSLLAGLIDSDGCVNSTNGMVDIRICGYSVVQQVAEILRSLGFDRVRTSHINHKNRAGSFRTWYDLYRVSFVVNDPVLISFSDKLTKYKDLVTKERGIDGRYETNEVLKILPLLQDTPEYVYDITTETGHFHCQGMIQHNCYNYSTLDTAHKGIPVGIDAEKSEPTKYLNTFFEHLQLFMVHCGNSSLGAVGAADLLLTVSAYAKRILTVQGDQHVNFVSQEDCWTYIKEKLTNFIYFLNQPNRVVQSLFSNVSIYDDKFIDSLVDFYYIEADGTTYFAEKGIVKKVQEIFIETMNEIMSRRLITFPVVTACFSLDEERNIQDEDFLRWVLNVDQKYRFINLYAGATSTLSSCCFDGKQKVLTKSSKGIKLCTFEEIANGLYEEYRNNFAVFHNGSWAKAKLVVLNEKRDMYKVVTHNNKVLYMTDNHLNLTKDGVKETKDLIAGKDYLAFNTRVLHTSLDDDRHLTYEQGILIGAYLGDGSKYKHKDCEGYEITFSLSAPKLHLLEPLTKALADWEIDRELHLYDSKNNVKFVKVFSKELYDIISDYVSGNNALEKSINPFVFGQSVEFRQGVLDGLYATDGGNTCRIYSSSERLIEDVETLCTTLGLNTIINEDPRETVNIRGVDYTRNAPVRCIKWYNLKGKRGMGDGVKVINNTEYFLIKSVEPYTYDGEKVYCFQMVNSDEPYFTLPNGVITHNCRLRSDKTNKHMKGVYTSSLGSGNTRVGSLGVTSQNLPRLAFLAKGDLATFKKLLGDNIRMSQRINGVKRQIIKKAIDGKMFPLYNLGYVDLRTQFSTTGVVGIYEALQVLGYDIKTLEGEAIAEDILRYINEVTDEMSDELEAPCNVEQIPAENVAVKLAKKDRLLGYNDKYDIYSNQYVPLKDMDADLFTRIRLVADLDKYMSGGSILHININEEVGDPETFVEMAKAMYKMGVVYFAYNKLLAFCSDCNHTFTTDKETFDANNVTCPECGSHNTECALRIVGFIRKFKSWSSERQAEGKQRKFYHSLVKGN